MKYAMKYEQLSVESKRTVNERGCHGHSLLTAGKSWVVNEGGGGVPWSVCGRRGRRGRHLPVCRSTRRAAGSCATASGSRWCGRRPAWRPAWRRGPRGPRVCCRTRGRRTGRTRRCTRRAACWAWAVARPRTRPPRTTTTTTTRWPLPPPPPREPATGARNATTAS